MAVAALAIAVLARPAHAQEQALAKAYVSYLGLTCEAPLFVAYEKGFFKEEGLDVEFVKLDWNSLKEGLSFGKVDATQHLVMYLLKPIEQGMDIRLTAGVHTGCLRVQTGVDSPITTVAELKGKRIGVPAIGSPPYLFATRTLLAAGLDPQKDVEWIAYPPPELGLALSKGQVDAIANAEPIGTVLTASGKVKTIADQAVDAPYKDEYCCDVLVSGKLAKEDPAKAAKLTRAILKGAKWVQTNPLAAATLAVEKKYVSSTPEINAQALAKLHFLPSVAGGEEAVRLGAAEMKRAGMLKDSTDPADLAKRAFLPLEGVSEEWIKNLEVEKVAGGQMPPDASMQATAASSDTAGVASCCDKSVDQ
jgi:NitT/TauT family transport system substrate-binding protein